MSIHAVHAGDLGLLMLSNHPTALKNGFDCLKPLPQLPRKHTLHDWLERSGEPSSTYSLLLSESCPSVFWYESIGKVPNHARSLEVLLKTSARLEVRDD